MVDCGGAFNPGLDQFAHVTFDLGGTYDLDVVRIWNLGEVTGGGSDYTFRGAKDLRVSVAPDAIVPSFANVLNTVLPQAPFYNNTWWTGLIDSTQLSLPAVGVRYVRFDITSNYGSDPFSSPEAFYTGLSEVQFSGNLSVTSVPEPATLTIVSALSGLLAVRRIRRNRSAT